MDSFFKNLPKMTNNHIHISAMVQYRKLIKLIKKIDPKLYDEIYVLNTDKYEVLGQYKYTVKIISEGCSEGMVYQDVTSASDWTKISELYTEFKNSLVIGQHIQDPFDQFEKIQAQFRIFIRNDKVYYYLWYASLYINYRNNVFYLNVRGKTGSISVGTKCGQRLFTESKYVLSVDEFNAKIKSFSENDKDIRPSDYKHIYKQYTRIKYESDLIMLAMYDFNRTQSYPEYVSGSHLLRNPNMNFNTVYDNKIPQMMVQYIMTFPKIDKKEELDLKLFTQVAKIYLYVAIIINIEYDFQFFNGIDLVGNEQTSHSLNDYIPALKKLSYFRKYGINIIPHIGETNTIEEEISPIERYVLDLPIVRVGHGISFVTNTKLLNAINESDNAFYIESCPISNYLLGYYNPKKHPLKNFVNHPKIKLMICSDDNAIFNYDSVKRDYIIIYKYWGVTMKEIKKLIINGINVIPKKYRQYYFDLFKYLWQKSKLDSLPDRPIFDEAPQEGGKYLTRGFINI